MGQADLERPWILGERTEWTVLFGLGIIGFILGMAIFVVGTAITPYARTPPGERWTKIGGPDH